MTNIKYNEYIGNNTQYENNVKRQLNEITSSNLFCLSKKLNDFLKYVVLETLNGKGERLKQYTIAVYSLGYHDNFDPDLNPYVRVLAGRLRVKLNQYYEGQGKSDPIIISMPKGSYQPVFEERAVKSPFLYLLKQRNYLNKKSISEFR